MVHSSELLLTSFKRKEIEEERKVNVAMLRLQRLAEEKRGDIERCAEGIVK